MGWLPEGLLSPTHLLIAFFILLGLVGREIKKQRNG